MMGTFGLMVFHQSDFFCMDNEQKKTSVFFGNNCHLACVRSFSILSARFSWFFMVSSKRMCDEHHLPDNIRK